MDELKELTQAFISIQAKYDGGRSYTWKQARSDLQRLEHRTNALHNRARAEWIRHMARLLHKEVRAMIKEKGDFGAKGAWVSCCCGN